MNEISCNIGPSCVVQRELNSGSLPSHVICWNEQKSTCMTYLSWICTLTTKFRFISVCHFCCAVFNTITQTRALSVQAYHFIRPPCNHSACTLRKQLRSQETYVILLPMHLLLGVHNLLFYIIHTNECILLYKTSKSLYPCRAIISNFWHGRAYFLGFFFNCVCFWLQ